MSDATIWDPEQANSTGASRDRIRKWESLHGVQLPRFLREAYREHNGGTLLGAPIELYPLEQITTPQSGFWDKLIVARIDEDAFEDRTRLLVFGWDYESGGQYYLNYNDCDASGEPSAWVYQADGNPIQRIARSASSYFKKRASISSDPEVDWSEVERLETLADESVDESSWLPPGTVSRYLLAQGDGVLFLYRQGLNLETGTQCHTRMTIPLPLNAERMTLRQRRGNGPWGLLLQPQNHEGIVLIESIELPAGGWRNRRIKGEPLADYFECESKDKLIELRVDLIGEHAASLRTAEELQTESAPDSSDETSDDELQNLGLQLMRAMQQDLPADENSLEFAQVKSHILHLSQQIQAEIANRTEGGPVPAEILSLVDQVKAEWEN